MIDQNKHLVGLSDGKILNLADRSFVYRDGVFVTKKLATIYDADAKCPLWQTFLDRIFESNRDVIAFVQKAVGYTLSGETTEQCLFFLLGTGANGKSTFLNGLDRLFGDYAATTPMQTLTASTFSNGKTNDLAALAGKRLVSASDGESGHKLAENRIKQLTGGDKISCAAMYKDLMTYVPQLKLWIATNDLPNVTGSDEAIMRRIRIVRFPVVIPPAERDQTLSASLAGEVAGIFNWALQGYSDWKKGGLRPPESVSEATTSYRRDNDLVGQFVEERCELLPAARASSKILYENYSGWCDENGHDPIQKVEFGKTLGRKGFKPKKLGGGAAGWSGLQLNPAEKMKATGA
jgi:putative DNA primase/helicase